MVPGHISWNLKFCKAVAVDLTDKNGLFGHDLKDDIQE